MTPILVVADEAGNARLVSPGAGHEVRAIAQFRKRKCTFHFLLQVPIAELFQNCRIHEWYFIMNAAIERKGIEDLGDPELNPPLSQLKVRERWVKKDNEIKFERAPYLDSAFVYPEITAIEVRKAIAEIRQRSEYGEQCQTSTGKNEEMTSSNAAPNTSSPPDTFSDISPARRLRTALLKNSGTTDCSDLSEK